MTGAARRGVMDELIRLLDDGRATEAAAARRRGRTLDAVAGESATLIGALVDLHESGQEIVVRTADAGTHRGAVRFVGADFAAVGDAWIATSAITTITPGARATPGDRTSPDPITLGEALGRVAAERPRLQLVLAGGERVAGVLRAAGADVLVLTLDGDAGERYVSLSSVRLVLRSG